MSAKKGYYTKEPSIHTKCSVCGLEPKTPDSITDDNWETCYGRDMFFCPEHRVRYPCYNAVCEADLCSNFHSEEDWLIHISDLWDYLTEDYD